jgi:hypothetical protein
MIPVIWQVWQITGQGLAALDERSIAIEGVQTAD